MYRWLIPIAGVLAVSLSSALFAAGEEGSLQQGMVNPGYQDKPAWFKASFLDIREDIDEAVAAGRRVMLYFYQDGCPYCAKLLRDNFGDRAIADKTRKGFDVIAINMWGDREVSDFSGDTVTEKRFAEALRVQYTPTLLMLDEQGGVVLRINGYFPPHKFAVALDFVSGRHEKTRRFGDFLARAEPVPANAYPNPLVGGLPHPLRLDMIEGEGRPLMVLFEKGSCRDCDVLHRETLTRTAVATAMSNLDFAQIDIGATEALTLHDGRRIAQRDWAKELDIQYAPSLVFFDRRGREVFRTEGYLRSFHVHGAMDYVVSGAYRWQPSFQRYLQHRTQVLHGRGIEVDLMN